MAGGGRMQEIDSLSVISIFRIFLGFTAIVLNCFILLLFYRRKSLRLRTHNVLVALLCGCEGVVGVGLVVRGAYGLYANAFGIDQFVKSTCFLVNAPIGVGKTASEVVTLAVAFDRLHAVLNPIAYAKYERRVTFVLGTVIAAGINCIALTWTKQIGADSDGLTSVCTASTTTGPFAFIVSSAYGGTFLLTLYATYAVSLYFLARHRRRQRLRGAGRHILELQTRVFVSVSLVIVSYSVCYGLPFLWSLVTLVFRVAPEWRTYATIVSGLAAGVNAILDAVIGLCKNEDINKSAKQTLASWIPGLAKSSRIWGSGSSGAVAVERKSCGVRLE